MEPGDRVRTFRPLPVRGTVLPAGWIGKVISKYKNLSLGDDEYVYEVVFSPRDIMVPVRENEVEKL